MEPAVMEETREPTVMEETQDNLQWAFDHLRAEISHVVTGAIRPRIESLLGMMVMERHLTFPDGFDCERSTTSQPVIEETDASIKLTITLTVPKVKSH